MCDRLLVQQQQQQFCGLCCSCGCCRAACSSSELLSVSLLIFVYFCVLWWGSHPVNMISAVLMFPSSAVCVFAASVCDLVKQNISRYQGIFSLLPVGLKFILIFTASLVSVWKPNHWEQSCYCHGLLCNSWWPFFIKWNISFNRIHWTLETGGDEVIWCGPIIKKFQLGINFFMPRSKAQNSNITARHNDVHIPNIMCFRLRTAGLYAALHNL